MKKDLIKIIIAGILYAFAIIIKFENIWINNTIYIVSYLIVGAEVLKEALEHILKGKVFDENFLMAIATIGAFFVGEYPEAVAVMLFYQVGELFQSYAVDKSKKSIASLMNIRPDFANVERNGKIEKVNPEEIKLEEIIIVKPGEKIPLDGIVVERKNKPRHKSINRRKYATRNKRKRPSIKWKHKLKWSNKNKSNKRIWRKYSK